MTDGELVLRVKEQLRNYEIDLKAMSDEVVALRQRHADHDGCADPEQLRQEREGRRQAEAAYQEAQITIAGLTAERDTYREQAARLRKLLEGSHD
jgi:hypothetical protein